MNYKDIFAVNEISFKQLNANHESTEDYFLNNYSHYDDKLENDFYLKSFLKKIMFEVHINNLNDFINFQYNNSNIPDDFINVLDNEVVPTIKDIVQNANLSLDSFGGFYDQTVLEDGFALSEGVIKHSLYTYQHFSHLVALNKNKNHILKKTEILEKFLKDINELEEGSINSPLKWNAGPAQLGYIISKLVQNGYIEAPLKSSFKNNDPVNYTRLAKSILSAFNVEGHNSIDSLRIYLSPTSVKYIEIEKHFNHLGFNLPKIKV